MIKRYIRKKRFVRKPRHRKRLAVGKFQEYVRHAIASSSTLVGDFGSSYIQRQRWRVNALNNPDYQGCGRKSGGVENMYQRYDRYHVYYAVLEMEFFNQGTTPCEVIYGTEQRALSLLTKSSEFDVLKEQLGTKRLILGSPGGLNKKRVRLAMPVWKLMGYHSKRAFFTDDRPGKLVINEDPLDNLYLFVYGLAFDNAALKLFCSYKLIQYTRWSQPKSSMPLGS